MTGPLKKPRDCEAPDARAYWQIHQPFREHRLKPGILAIDIGGTGLKAVVLNAAGTMETARERVPTPHPCPPEALLAALQTMVEKLPPFDRISAGFPGVVRDGVILTAPNLGTSDWAGFHLAEALSQHFGKHPVKVINDADMQGFALVDGVGVELAVTLGTGVGTALFRDGALMPHLEIAHHPMHKHKTYDEYLGDAALKKIGKKRWNKRVRYAIDLLEALCNPHRIYIGGGNAANLEVKLPDNVVIGSNDAGLIGGAKLWSKAGHTVEPIRHGA
jgi:polyphosphate glucokinase